MTQLEQAQKDAQVLLHCFRASNDKHAQEMVGRIIDALQKPAVDLDALKKMALEGVMKGREHSKNLEYIAFDIISESFNILNQRGMICQGWLCKDDQEQAVWQAIQDIEIGNKTDDKLIVANLHKAGFTLVRFRPGTPEPANPPYCGSCGITTTDNLCACDRGQS